MNPFPANLLRATAAALLAAAAGFAAPVHALNLSQVPMHLGGSVKPNFIMAIDDSISMGEERTFPGGNLAYLAWNPENNSFFKTAQPESLSYYVPGEDDPSLSFAYYGGLYGDGNSAYFSATTAFPPLDSFGFARSPDFNRSYFNPARTYGPWKKASGESWPNANPSATRADPRPGAAFSAGHDTIYNLTDPEGRKNPKDVGFHFLTGMTVPAGITYRTESDAAQCEDMLPGTNGAWMELEEEFVAGYFMQGCKVNMPYFPAVFFLRNKESLPAKFGYVAEPKFVADALGPDGAGLYKYEIRQENFGSAETYQAAIQNFANWFQYHRNRFLVTVAAMTESLLDIRGVRVAQFQINDLQDVDMYDMDDGLGRAAIYDRVTGFQAAAILYPNTPGKTGTPNRNAVAHIGQQFQRTDYDAPIEAACQINVGMLFTDGYTQKNTGPNTFGNADGALDAPFSDVYSNTMADIVTAYYEGAETPLRDDLETGRVPTPAACSEGDVDPRIDCQKNLHVRFNAIAYGPSGAIYDVQPAPTQDPFANHPDWNSLGSPKITDKPVVVDELWHSTLNGRGQFVNAQTPDEIAEAMRDMLVGVSKSSFSGGSAGSSTRRDASFLAYTPKYVTDDWTGDVSAHTVSEDGTFATKVWSAAERLEEIEPSGRNVYYVDTPTTMKEFTVENLGATIVDDLGLKSATPFNLALEDVVQYLRGDHSHEKRFGGVLRNRSTRIGDIFGSQPDVLTTAGYGYTGLPESEGGESYADFMDFKRMRTPVLVVGSNNGMLHGFNASASQDGGKEIFAIIPRTVMKNLGKLPDPNYVHKYFVDGSPVQGDAFDGSAWRTMMLVPMGAGGKSVMAIDVTDPTSSFDEKNLLWEFSDPGLQETIGKPSIVLLKGGVWAAVFGSGIDSGDPENPEDKGSAYVYVVNLFSGKLISKLHVNDAENDSIHSDGFVNIAPVDTDFDLEADTFYAADYDGVLWRMDVGDGGTLTLGNGGKPLFRAVDQRPLLVTGGIDSFPHHIRGQMVFFGTGRYLDVEADQGIGSQTQAFYGIWDDPEKSGQEVTRADLKVQKILAEEAVDGVAMRTVEDNAIDWQTQRGWVLDLKVDGQALDGEKFIGHPTVVLGKVVFVTYAPPADACGAGGRNRLYSLSAISGGGEYVVGGGVYGSAELGVTSAGAGPVIAPTLISTPPEPICIPGEPGCPTPELVPDDEGNVTAAASPGCKTALGVLLGDQLLDFSSVTCGRQSWKQAR